MSPRGHERQIFHVCIDGGFLESGRFRMTAGSLTAPTAIGLRANYCGIKKLNRCEQLLRGPDPDPRCRTLAVICSGQCSPSCAQRGQCRASTGLPCSARWRPPSLYPRTLMCSSPLMPAWILPLLPGSADSSKGLRKRSI